MEGMTSLEKAINILNIFTEKPYRYTVGDIVELTGMNRTTVYRNLKTLENSGLLMRNSGDKSYSMGPVAFRLGNTYLNNVNYQENILNILEEIGKETHESVGLARREGYRVMSIYSVEIHQAIKMHDKPGTFYPANKGTYGKGLMAYHEEISEELLKSGEILLADDCSLTAPADIMKEYEKIRREGFVLSIEETFSYVIGVGVPLVSQDGNVRHMLAVSFFKQDNWKEEIERIKEILFKYKGELEKYMV